MSTSESQDLLFVLKVFFIEDIDLLIQGDLKYDLPWTAGFFSTRKFLWSINCQKY